MPILSIPDRVAAQARQEALASYRAERGLGNPPVAAAGAVRHHAAGVLSSIVAPSLVEDERLYVPEITVARWLAAEALFKQALRFRSRQVNRAILARSGS